MPRSVRLVELTSTAMTALVAGDLAGAGEAVGLKLTDYFLGDDARWLWQYRVDQLAMDPSGVGWLVKVIVAEPGEVVVGHAGFHGPPDESGMVEIGYSIDPAHRRQGYARATVTALLRRAAAEPGIRTVRASISPTNTGSLATIAGFGFLEVGEHWDERDGQELVFELPLP
jgi:RimJ/RimL family protein N-acetyltransferase